MGIFEIFMIGVGLSMDAFAVSIAKGLAVRKVRVRNALSVGLWFGGFQALMPLAGYFLGSSFASYVENFDHWIAFGLLVLIGANMIREALGGDDSDHGGDDWRFRTMLLLAVATSIDALACGISFAFLGATSIWLDIAIIGATTFVFSVAGLFLGNLAGSRYHRPAEIFGGVVLIAIGLKILLEHLLA